MSIAELNDDELMLIDKIQREITNRYVGRPFDLTLVAGMQEDIKDRFLKIGLIVSVGYETHAGRTIPTVQIEGRSDPILSGYLNKETDHERKAFDARKHPKEELKKLLPNQLNLLE